jgi:hypothetical protein
MAVYTLFIAFFQKDVGLIGRMGVVTIVASICHSLVGVLFFKSPLFMAHEAELVSGRPRQRLKL